MKVKLMQVGPIGTNCYLLEDEETGKAAVIDPGEEADRILELNTEHPAVQAMEAAMTSDRAKAELYAKILYDQALLIAGLPLEDPSEYTDLVAELMK